MVDIVDRYRDFVELRSNELEGRDYLISFRRGYSGIVVMAPHGGDIEPGTTEIADALAGKEHSFYSFEGTRTSGNLKLHITSTHFDEPVAAGMACEAATIIVIHGCKGPDPMVCLGGLDTRLKEVCRRVLSKAGFHVGERHALAGTNGLNLCNRGLQGGGLQLEFTNGLRRTLFRDLTREGRNHKTHLFENLIAALREAVDTFRKEKSQ